MREIPSKPIVGENEFNLLQDEYQAIGLQIVEMLGLRLNNHGHISTNWGPKTPAAVAKMIEDLLFQEIT